MVSPNFGKSSVPWRICGRLVVILRLVWRQPPTSRTHRLSRPQRRQSSSDREPSDVCSWTRCNNRRASGQRKTFWKVVNMSGMARYEQLYRRIFLLSNPDAKLQRYPSRVPDFDCLSWGQSHEALPLADLLGDLRGKESGGEPRDRETRRFLKHAIIF